MQLATERSAPVPHGRPRDELREQAMLEAALELLVEVGYDRLSIDAIAARSHSSKATFYRRWANKAEVVSEALRRFKGRCGDDPNLDTGSLRGDLVAKVSWLCSEVSLDGALVAGVMRAMHSDPALAELVHQQVLGGKLGAAAGMADRAVRRGELVEGAPVELAFEVATSMIFSRTLLADEPADRAFAEHLVDDILLPLLGVARQGAAGTASSKDAEKPGDRTRTKTPTIAPPRSARPEGAA